MAQCYADAIEAAGLDFDLLFGPAYKGIPLATALACAYAGRGRDLPLAFNRKEAKDHGEGGTLIGAPLAGRQVLIVDDVITAGTAIREALAIIRAAGGTPSGIAVALDRQEIASDQDRRSAAQAVAAEAGIPVIAVANLGDLLALRQETPTLWASRNRCWPIVAATGPTPQADGRRQGGCDDANTDTFGIIRRCGGCRCDIGHGCAGRCARQAGRQEAVLLEPERRPRVQRYAAPGGGEPGARRIQRQERDA